MHGVIGQTETFLDGRVMQHCGDVRAVLATMEPDSIDCVVTSPPYWGLRDYGVAGQLGLERSLGEHLAVMVDVFGAVRRVLKPAGTLWLNYGDCYVTSPNGRSAAATKAAGNDDRTFRDKPFSTIGPVLQYSKANAVRNRNSRAKESYRPDAGNRIHAGGYLKPGDLCMVPNRLAIALQDDGWWVKAENIWGKTNPMPDSSGVIRPSSAHEKVWLLAKSDECEFWRARDNGEISGTPDLTERVPMITTGEMAPRWIRMPFYYDAAGVRLTRSTEADGKKPDGWNTRQGGHGSFHPAGRERGARIDKRGGHTRRHAGFNDRWDQMERAEQVANGRLLRNYEPAGVDVWAMATSPLSEAHFATFPPELAERCIKAGCPEGGAVLDPFGGAGTTALVAASLGRNATLIELNPEYCRLARTRIEAAFMGKEEGARHMTRQLGRTAAPGPLFAGAAE